MEWQTLECDAAAKDESGSGRLSDSVLVAVGQYHGVPVSGEVGVWKQACIAESGVIQRREGP